jgi:hypothetical protein
LLACSSLEAAYALLDVGIRYDVIDLQNSSPCLRNVSPIGAHTEKLKKVKRFSPRSYCATMAN